MTITLSGTWLAEVYDGWLCDNGPYYPELSEYTGMVINGGWADAAWALLNHMSTQLTNVTEATCGPCKMVDPYGTLDRCETRFLAVLKALRSAEPEAPWEFEMDRCRYRIFVAGTQVNQQPRVVMEHPVDPDILVVGTCDPTHRSPRRSRRGQC